MTAELCGLPAPLTSSTLDPFCGGHAYAHCHAAADCWYYCCPWGYLGISIVPNVLDFEQCPLLQNVPQTCMPSCRMVLDGPLFKQYFDKVEVSNFEVASDAFSTFKVGWLLHAVHTQFKLRGSACSCAL